MEPLTVVGEPPLARDEQGRLKSRIGTVFVPRGILVTLPGIHATQRLAYSEFVNERRAAGGLPALTEEEEAREWEESVDLIIEDDLILIRPDPDNMELAFRADELLQLSISKRQINYLHVMDRQVQMAIKRRGELWRIAPLPQSVAEMQRMILTSRIGIACGAIYYHNRISGTRYLTCHAFASLARLDAPALASQLEEIRRYAGERNRLGNPEIDFFAADGGFGVADLTGLDFLSAEPAQLAQWHQERAAKFQNAVRPELREDDPNSAAWRNSMFAALIRRSHEPVADEILRGLSPEFFLQVRWLPGGRIEEGELIFDSIFDELATHPADAALIGLCDANARSFIFNFMREFGNVEYVNVGRIVDSLSQRARTTNAHVGTRGVYIAEIKQRDNAQPHIRIIRMQKWGILHHLDDQNKDLVRAIMESEDYTEYVLDRRLGCRQLGMRLPNHITTRKISEKYHGCRKEFDGLMIWHTYFERDYIHGVATDKIAIPKYRNSQFALRLGWLLGEAAAANIIVGRANLEGKMLFDDGDEVVIEDANGMPERIIVTDHTGTFANFTAALTDCAADYARPVIRRLDWVPNPAEFADAYVTAFVGRFLRIQDEYRRRRRAFDTLFQQREPDARGNFAYRWIKILDRLDHADAQAVGDAIRSHIQC